mmetsp:Transcript_28319/g.69357  ORF Transcript_28319/g.69357 Transcript_28319/m.69357 type:complete len:207 (-) Transcript_28319:1605-2225(-)
MQQHREEGARARRDGPPPATAGTGQDGERRVGGVQGKRSGKGAGAASCRHGRPHGHDRPRVCQEAVSRRAREDQARHRAGRLRRVVDLQRAFRRKPWCRQDNGGTALLQVPRPTSHPAREGRAPGDVGAQARLWRPARAGGPPQEGQKGGGGGHFCRRGLCPEPQGGQERQAGARLHPPSRGEAQGAVWARCLCVCRLRKAHGQAL